MTIFEPFLIKEPENKIADFIEGLTGLRPKEIEDSVTFKLILGLKDPIEIGFIKANHPGKSILTIKYSMYVKMLEVISGQMKSLKDFQFWCAVQNEFKAITNQN